MAHIRGYFHHGGRKRKGTIRKIRASHDFVCCLCMNCKDIGRNVTLMMLVLVVENKHEIQKPGMTDQFAQVITGQAAFAMMT